jgi:hexosaminidase
MTTLRLLLCCYLQIPLLSQVDIHATWQQMEPLPCLQDEAQGLHLQLRLENRGQRPLPAAGWSLFFSCAHGLKAMAGSPFTLENLGGDFQRVRPGVSFKATAPGQATVLDFWMSAQGANRSAVPAGLYLVDDRKPARGFIVPVDAVPFSAQAAVPGVDRATLARFEQNASIPDLPEQAIPPVFPTPASLSKEPGDLHLQTMPRIRASHGLESEARLLTSYLAPYLRFRGGEPAPDIRLEIGEVAGLPGPEAYELSIQPGQGIRLRGATAAGVFYGLQTLRGLLPVAPGGTDLHLPAVTVKDAPRFAYRGLHLDVARNFQPKTSVFRVLELMARYKLNTFHFHLTDDEGWRLEIRGLPELTAVGGVRGHTLSAERWLPPAYGSGPRTDSRFGTGFFTRADYIQILQYAQRLHIEVIPELEMPGHARAALKAMEARYRSLVRRGEKDEAERYRLVEPGDTSRYVSAQNYHDNVMNPALPATHAFIAKVVAEVVALHREAGVPLKHLHMGGDEVPAGVWEQSPAVQAYLKTRGWSTVNALWPEFYDRVDGLLRQFGLPLSGWEEIALKKVQSGGKTSQEVNTAFGTRGWRAYVWNNVPGWGNEDLAYQLANAGFSVVLCPVTNLYFDLAATPDPEEWGLRWGGILDVDKPFDFIPLDYYRSTHQDHLGQPLDPAVFAGKVRLSDAGRKNIVGIQGCLWSETLTEDGRLEFMLTPKLLGLAERAWAPDPAWATDTDSPHAEALRHEDWSRFLNRLGKQELPRLALEQVPFRFRIPAPGLKIAMGQVLGNCQFPGLLLRYTTDGSEPTAHSPIFPGTLPAVGVVRVAAFDAVGRKGPTAAARCGSDSPRP